MVLSITKKVVLLRDFFGLDVFCCCFFFGFKHFRELWFSSLDFWKTNFDWKTSKMGLLDSTGSFQYVGVVLLMAEILHQLRLVAYPIIYLQGLYIPGGFWDFFHQQYLLGFHRMIIKQTYLGVFLLVVGLNFDRFMRSVLLLECTWVTSKRGHSCFWYSLPNWEKNPPTLNPVELILQSSSWNGCRWRWNRWTPEPQKGYLGTPTVVSSEGACTCAETLGAGAGGSVLSGGASWFLRSNVWQTRQWKSLKLLIGNKSTNPGFSFCYIATLLHAVRPWFTVGKEPTPARPSWTRHPLTCCNLWRPSAWRQWRKRWS